MPSILKSSISIVTAQQFIDLLNNNTNIYVGVGRDNTKPWSNENVPATPIDNIVDENSFRTDLIGIKKISQSNIMLMVARNNWAPGKTFNTISTTSPSASFASDYYCITSKNFVYQCIGKTSSDIITTAGSEPDLKLPSVKTADGYTWKFLYDITTAMVNDKMLLDDWMPVPYNKNGVYPGGTITEDQHLYGDKFANRTIGAHRILISGILGNEGTAIPYNTEYRQIGLFYNPTNKSGELISGSNYSKADFDNMSGDMLYLENTRVKTRAEGQTELIQIIITF